MKKELPPTAGDQRAAHTPPGCWWETRSLLSATSRLLRLPRRLLPAHSHTSQEMISSGYHRMGRPRKSDEVALMAECPSSFVRGRQVCYKPHTRCKEEEAETSIPAPMVGLGASIILTILASKYGVRVLIYGANSINCDNQKLYDGFAKVEFSSKIAVPIFEKKC